MKPRLAAVGLRGAPVPVIPTGHGASTGRLRRAFVRPDVLLCGVELDQTSAPLPELVALARRDRVLVVSATVARHSIDTAYACGARGFLPAGTPAEDVLRTARAIVDGGQAWPAGWAPPGGAGSSLTATPLAGLDDFDLISSHARASERARYSRALHDRTLQLLEVLHASGHVTDPELCRHLAQEARWLRGLVESGLQPTAAALPDVLDDVVDRFRRTSLDVTLRCDRQPPAPVPPSVVEAFEGGVTEALNNVRRHSRAGCASVTLAHDSRSVTVVVADPGIGFEPDRLRAGHLGVPHSITGRMAAVGGWATVTSAPGAGTRVSLGYRYR